MSGTSLVGVRRSVLTVAFTLAACALTSIPRVEAQSIATQLGVTSRSAAANEVIPSPSPVRIRPYVEIGLYGTGAYFPDFSNRVGDQPNIATFEGDRFIPGFGLGLEFGSRHFPLYSRFDFNYGKQNFSQTFNSTGPLVASSADGEVTGKFLDFRLGWHFCPCWFHHAKWDWAFGPTWARNDLHYIEKYPSGLTQELDREESGWKWDLGTRLTIPFKRDFGFQIGTDYTTAFKKNDADQNFRLSTGLSYTFTHHREFRGNPGF